MGVAHPLLVIGLALATAWPLAIWMERVVAGRTGLVGRVVGPCERLVLRGIGASARGEMRARTYTVAVLTFSGVSIAALFALQRLQGLLPVNPDGQGAVDPDLAFATAVSFVTNTNWQSYVPEQTMSHLTQMAGLGVQNFVSAGVGLAVAVALVRGLTRSDSATIGNFWVDLVRMVLYVLLPLSLALALPLALRGVVMTFQGAIEVVGLDGATQEIARGPAASQVAIKQLGTNGGGFFNANSAHPFENPTALTNLLQNWALLTIPLAMPLMYGRMVGRVRHGVAVLAAMLVLLGGGLAVAGLAEHQGTPALAAAGYEGAANLEGKEQRFGVDEAVTWSITTTGTSTGAINAQHSSFSAGAGGTQLAMMLLGEVAPGGVGAGLYGMLLFVVVAVFLGGLMVGRTPELLGKRLRAREVKLAMLGVLVMPLGFLLGVAVVASSDAGRAGPLNEGPHGLTEILYAFASAWNNNGSAFAGITADTSFYNLTLGVAMLLGRFAVIVPVLALAGALAAQTRRPEGGATLPSASPTFVVLLVGTVLLVGALAFFPALALGPIAEALSEGLR